jgi:8-oxo-dGTP diphosphatase
MAEAQFWIGVHGVIEEHGRMLVLRRALRMPYKPGAWDLPGGHLALHETLEECLRREIGEETGLEVEIARMLGARKASARPYVQVLYACKPTSSRREVVLQPREHSDARWVTVEELMALGELIPYLEDAVKWGMLRHVRMSDP